MLAPVECKSKQFVFELCELFAIKLFSLVLFHKSRFSFRSCMCVGSACVCFCSTYCWYVSKNRARSLHVSRWPRCRTSMCTFLFSTKFIFLESMNHVIGSRLPQTKIHWRTQLHFPFFISVHSIHCYIAICAPMNSVHINTYTHRQSTERERDREKNASPKSNNLSQKYKKIAEHKFNCSGLSESRSREKKHDEKKQ